MKKPVLNLIFFSLLLIPGCSTGKVSTPQLNKKQNAFVNDYSIRFDKIIPTGFTASGTLRITKIGDYIIIYDGHVDALKLVCLEYSTGQELWSAGAGVRRYYFKDGLLVVQYNDSIEMFEIATGTSVWKLHNCIITYGHPEGSELADQIAVVYNGNDAMLDITKKEIFDGGGKALPAMLYRFGKNGRVDQLSTDLKDTYQLGEKFLLADIVENPNGDQHIFIWSLNKESREFTLNIYDSENKKLKEHHWTIPKNNYKEASDAYFSGLPEPDKLEPSSYVIGDQLIIFENYTRYRWSWGMGTNRITSVNLSTLEMKYQIWGQAPENKGFNTFLFFKDLVLLSDGIMHFQNEPASYTMFDLEKGKVLDTIRYKFTCLEDYVPGILIGFNYEHKQIKETDYTNRVSVKAWDYINNEYSKTFDFEFNEQYPYEPYVSNDGTIIFNYYDKGSRKDMLYCCKVVQSTN